MARKVPIHSYQWFIHDWWSSETRHKASASARGIYRELIDFHYEHGSIPADLEVQARLCLVSMAEMATAWEQIGDQFRPMVGHPGRLVSDNVLIKRKSLLAYRQQQADRAGKRWENKPNKISGLDTTALPHRGNGAVIPQRTTYYNLQSSLSLVDSIPCEAVDPNPSSPISAEMGKSESPPNPKKILVDRLFEQVFWPAVWLKVGKEAARKAFPGALRRFCSEGGCLAPEAAEKLAGEARNEKERALVAGHEWRSRLHPSTWLNGARWKDEVIAQANGHRGDHASIVAELKRRRTILHEPEEEQQQEAEA